MGLWLKQNTAVDVLIGPFVDSGDGNTTEELLTIEDEHVLLSKLGQALAAKNDANDATHDDLGYYNCPLNGTDTNTLGTLQLCCHMAGALPVYHEYMVVTANVYDTLCSTDILQSDLTQIGGVAQSATDLKDLADTGYDPTTHKIQGVVLTDTTTTNTDLTAFAVNYTAARAGYLDELAAANLPTDVANVKAETALIVADTNELQTDWVNGGRLDLLVDAILADTGELQTDWANGGRLDLLLDAIKAVTDTLTLVAIADAVHDEVTEGTTTLRQAIRLLLSHHTGKSSGGGTNTLVYRDIGDSKDRLTYTVDADGNRSAVVRDGA